MNFVTGSSDYYHSHNEVKWNKARQDGRAKIFIAGDLAQANLTKLRDIQYRVPVTVQNEWYKMAQESITSRIKDGKAYNSIRVSQLV